jgi:hypothetical protein
MYRARRAVFCAAMVGLGMIVLPVHAQDVEVEVVEVKEPKPLLMSTLEENTGFGKWLVDHGMTIDGYAQLSFTHSFSSPPGDVIDGRGFDFENDDLTLNGIAVNFHKDLEPNTEKFDIGHGLDLLYGGDARFTKSNGLFDSSGFAFDGEGDGPDQQFDITQAFVTFNVPVGRGLLITAGKFITPIGYEYVDPRKNTLYSHGFLFNFGAPFSQTGVMGKYNLSDEMKVSAGITRGWDQSLEDTNGKIDFLGTIEYAPDDQWSYTLVLSTGPQSDSPDGWQTVVDALIGYTMDDHWYFGAEAMIGYEADVPGDDSAWWYGVAVYPSYKLTDMISLNGRAEWFADPDGARGVGADNVFEFTAGVAIQPFVNTDYGNILTIRPELRWDIADDDAFDGGTDDQQVTFAIDAVFAF